ncbi:HD domain-containing protein [Gracilimonas sediminicola]|uniref:HD domain-containing protein n=1 Tax=Gracilimonas sediminicola TaxID=2952158 RepID=A0A9X2L4R7_9BACT|nr:HD domain-containing protein [Gracilimonas sediminicola]MCP9292371.1 HD domain-containing protein [Gracilimonas sediminicola]
MHEFLTMDSEIIEKTEEYVRKKLQGEGTGHDWWHIHRVRNTALQLAKIEDADLFIVELAALLHDIADHKFHDGDEEIGPATARNWLENLGVGESIINRVCTIIRDVSFKGAEVETKMDSIEGKVVQDADRLDALGAIGIARAFAYGGHKGRELYNPEIKPESHATFEAYKKSTGPTLNHFYEKLFLLKDRMNTQAGRKEAEKRHQFMKEFVDQFFSEWGGDFEL